MGLFKKLFSKKDTEPDVLTRIQAIASNSAEALPGYLLYPTDPISQKMFEPNMMTIANKHCGYQLRLYGEIANPHPEVKQQTPPFEINETHVFWKEEAPAWCSISTMKGESVKTSNLHNWVESQDQLGCMFDSMIPFLNLPSCREELTYKRVKMYYLGESKEYNQLHDLEETHVYCHVFYLDEQLFKKFILCAKRGISSWKVECTIPTMAEQLMPTDMVPPGQVFGSFFPYL